MSIFVKKKRRSGKIGGIMPLYTKESLESLRHKTDLVEVISSYVPLTRSGASYKGLCPFHDEKTPSFMIHKGDTHYHCFGCGAHGDAIHFLMAYQKMPFADAVQHLAEKFHVQLETVERQGESTGPNKKLLRDTLEKAARFFHFYLLHAEEARAALGYLFERGISLEFIRQFQVGLAPLHEGMLRKILYEYGISDEILLASGLIAQRSSGGYREFFCDRITFPIQDAAGHVIGFSARKYKEETFGGKYINTSETALFKKSRVLFGLHHSRRRIAKERQVIVVEGQIDALRLVHEGFNFTVAGQGTAFGEEHVQELKTLGVTQAYLAFDSDTAGMTAAAKVGHLFQREGIEVGVISLPQGTDPDSFLRKAGTEKFKELLEKSRHYLDFLVDFHAKSINITTPAGKNQLVQLLIKQIREWRHSLMIHESLKRLANLLQVPEHVMGVGQDYQPNVHIRKSASIGMQKIDPIQILEADFLRWLLLMGAQQPHFPLIAQKNVKPEDLLDPACRRVYVAYIEQTRSGRPLDTLSLIQQQEDQELLSIMMQKRVQIERAEELFIETVQKILDRNWMEKREEIRREIQAGQCSDERALQLMKLFDALKKQKPEIQFPEKTPIFQ